MSEFEMDAETRAVSRSPVFQRLIAESRASIAREGTITLEELERKYPATPDELAYAEAYSRALDALEEMQQREVDDTQARMLKVVLSAVDHVRGVGTVEQLARDAGVPARSVRVVAAALKGAGIGAEPRPLAEVGTTAS